MAYLFDRWMPAATEAGFLRSVSPNPNLRERPALERSEMGRFASTCTYTRSRAFLEKLRKRRIIILEFYCRTASRKAYCCKQKVASHEMKHQRKRPFIEPSKLWSSPVKLRWWDREKDVAVRVSCPSALEYRALSRVFVFWEIVSFLHSLDGPRLANLEKITVKQRE